MASSWTLSLMLCSLAHGANLDHFTKLGNNSEDVACRKTNGLNSVIGEAYWQLSGIPTAEQCATLCLEVLNDCHGFEYENMSSATSGRCELWFEPVTPTSVDSHNLLYCYNRTNFQSNTATAQFVSLTLNFTGLNTSSVNTTIVNAMTRTIKTEFSSHLSSLADRPAVNISEDEVQPVIMNCETVAIVIRPPVGTNLIPIYESLSYYQSQGTGANTNQGSKRVALRTALNAALNSYGLNFPHNEQNPRAIGNIAGAPSASSSCTAAEITISSDAQIKQISVLATLIVAALLGA